MPTDREKILIGALDVNDGENFDLESLLFTPAQKKPTWVSNNDADGDRLARESHYTPSYFEMEIRVAHQVDTAAALAQLGELTDAVQGCEREEGGRPLPWTPHTTGDAYTAYALSGDITELPIAVVGDGAGWFIQCPKVKVKLTCRPFLERDERLVLDTTKSAAEPLQEVFIDGIEGDVPALGRLIVTDEAAQDRRYAAWARDVVLDEEVPGCLITAVDLVTEGFSGAAKTRTGAYGAEKVVRATAVSQATAMCGTGRIEQVGTFGIYLRVYTDSPDARIRISYRNGDGPLVPLPWRAAPVTGFAELYMGEVFFDEVELGDQSSEIRVETRSTGAALELDANYAILWPTRASAKARGIANNLPTRLLAYDEFLQAEGALAAKKLPLGGEWAGAGDANDFTVIAADDVLRRTAVSDVSLVLGRFALAGATEYTTVSVSVAITTTAKSNGKQRFGVLARYTSANDWLMAVVIAETGALSLEVLKCIEGAVAVVSAAPFAPITPSSTLGDDTVVLTVAANGVWEAKVLGGAKEPVVSGQDFDLASGGDLEKGRVGIYDAWTDGAACTRNFDRFSALGAEDPGRACFAGRSIEFNDQAVLREDATGIFAGSPSFYRGAGFFLEPEGDLGLINRVVTRMRRNDVEAEADSAVTDKHSIKVLATERFLLPR